MKKTGKRLRRAASLLLSLCLSAGLLTTAALASDAPAAPTNLRFEIEPHDPKQEKVSNSPTDTHPWALVWRWDKENHWRNCLEEGCSEQTDKATHSMDSDGSCTVCGYDPKYPELPVPTNLRWDDTVARWDPVEGITNYRVTLYQNGKIMWNQDIRTTEKDFSGWLKDPGEFYFTVAPMKAGLNYSFPSPVPHWAAQSPAYTVEGSEELNPSNPTVIERIELDMDAPAAGQPLGRPRTAEGALYQVDGFSWQLCAGPGGSGIEYLFSGEDNFENGKCYRLYIGLQAEFNCVISENATATFGGLSPDRIEIETSEHGDISSIVAWFTVGTPTVPTEISELTFSNIPEPTSGINFTEAQEAAQTHINDSVAGIYQARVSYYKWDGEKDWDGQYSSDAYDENGHYALGLELKAADGYKFGKDITVTVNGKTARIISQSDYSIEVFMLFDSNPADPLVIKDVAIMSDVWPHDKDEINIKDNNFYINDAYYIFYHMVMFTIEEAKLKVSEDKGETWRFLTDEDTHFDADLQYGFFITVKALDGAKFDANMEGWIRGSADVTVSEDGKTAYLSRDNLRVYKEAGVYLKHKEEYVWDYDSVPVAINKPEAGAATSVPEGAAAALLMTGSLGVKASGVWYEVPYVGSTYALKSKPTTFEAGKTYMLAVELTCDSGGEYSFGDTFEVERFVEYSNVDNNIDYARKETVPTNDPHFSQKYNYWFTVGAYSEPEKITSINITGPEVLRDALGDETIFSFSEEQLAQFKVDGDITVKDIWWSGSGRLYLDLAVPSGHYFEIPSKLSVKYNGSDAQIYTVGFGVLHPYDLLSVTIMDVPSAAATVTQGGGVKEYETLESAVAALGENKGVITLLRSAEVVGTDGSSILSIPVTAELKINENATLTVPEGKTLQLANPAFLNSPGSIAVEAGGTLNIPDSTGNRTAFVGADDSARIKLTAGQMTFQIGENLLTLAKNAQAEIPKGQEAWLLKSTDDKEKLPLDAVIETGAHLTVNGTLNIISGSNQAGSTLTVKGTLDGTNGNISLAQYGEIVVDQGGVLQTNAASMLRALGTARVMTGGTLTIDGAEMIGSNSLNVDEGGVRLQPNDRGGFTCTVETGGKATVKGHWMDGDENGYRIAKSDDFIVDGELVLAYRTELSGNMTVENGGNLLIDENGALYAFSTEGSSPSLTVQEGGNVQVSGKLAVADKNAVVTGTYNLADNGKVYAESEISQHLVNAVVSENKTFENHTYAYAWEAERKTSTPPSLGGSGGVSTYAITVEDSENGEVESSRTRAARGDTVTLTVTPDEGYELDTLTVTDSKGEELELTNKGGGKYTFEMPSGKVTVEAEFVQEEAAELPFTDVPEDEWYYDAVAYAYENGWMNGTTSTTFAPGLTTSRAMIVTILHRIEGLPSIQESSAFLDVPLDAWYADAVAWAAEHGIVEGYSDTAFGPNDPITREQMAAILYRYAQYKGYDVSAKADLNKFTDADEISNYALEALQWANAEGLINGKGDGVLDPKGQATRAEAAVILMRFIEDVAK